MNRRVRPHPKQRRALAYLHEHGPLSGHEAAEDLAASCCVQSGFENKAALLYRLVLNGWAEVQITNNGRAAYRRG